MTGFPQKCQSSGRSDAKSYARSTPRPQSDPLRRGENCHPLKDDSVMTDEERCAHSPCRKHDIPLYFSKGAADSEARLEFLGATRRDRSLLRAAPSLVYTDNQNIQA